MQFQLAIYLIKQPLLRNFTQVELPSELLHKFMGVVIFEHFDLFNHLLVKLDCQYANRLKIIDTLYFGSF